MRFPQRGFRQLPRGTAMRRRHLTSPTMTAGCLAQAIYACDSKGLVTTSRGDKLPSHKQKVSPPRCAALGRPGCRCLAAYLHQEHTSDQSC